TGHVDPQPEHNGTIDDLTSRTVQHLLMPRVDPQPTVPQPTMRRPHHEVRQRSRSHRRRPQLGRKTRRVRVHPNLAPTRRRVRIRLHLLNLQRETVERPRAHQRLVPAVAGAVHRLQLAPQSLFRPRLRTRTRTRTRLVRTAPVATSSTVIPGALRSSAPAISLCHTSETYRTQR